MSETEIYASYFQLQKTSPVLELHCNFCRESLSNLETNLVFFLQI